ncbi:hypothetical protein LJQ72_06790 [Pectobacterium brasiliense]|uniref:MAE_28990/MAE_18760 family HEPN-like nuclease n=1 Tax=Pectobacterium brasiliense TaxID=180957 RepID=UPI001D0D7A42|nr:MAE_28990/MAE_18760 family HEPN-like nuclease [Pectobacterium brasiliense]UDQ77263.1 hypothetical protein LJQ72_06790 [Pectobacterium brasiliense]
MIKEKREFKIRDNEIRKFLTLISLVENNNLSIETSSDLDIVKTNPILKASAMLALYNMIESTVSNLLKYIHTEVCSKQLTYDEINDDIKNLYIIYHYKFKNKKADDVHQFAGLMNETLKLVTGKKKFDLKYQKMSEYYSIYSGNLDAKKIRTTLMKYGIKIPYFKNEHNKLIKLNESEVKILKDIGNEKIIIGYSLNVIMNTRNKLAHGEFSFEEYGRTLVTDDLNNFYKDTLFFLRLIILKVHFYIKKERFRAKQTP